MTLSSTGVLTTINGGIDTDQVIVLGENTNFTLTDTSLTVGGSTFTLSGFEDANLTGGGGANTFDVGAWSGSASLDGAGGTDTITDTLASNGTGFTLSDNLAHPNRRLQLLPRQLRWRDGRSHGRRERQHIHRRHLDGRRQR